MFPCRVSWESVPRKPLPYRLLFLAVCALPACAQLPFYTDDPAVTEPGKWHFEFFDEIDALQHPLFPDLKQNTANYKLNYGLPHNLELDVDSPYLSIFRALGDLPGSSVGVGDTNLGIKWQIHKEAPSSRVPAFGASLYVEFPTGDVKQELGSGLMDYWLNLIAQKSLSEKSRVTANAGVLFAGNTSTGLIGIQATRGRVYTGGLSLLRDFNPKWTLGVEVYGGYTNAQGLGKSQLQFMGGGQYNMRDGLAFCFGLLGGRYVGSPRVGGQIGFAIDFPAVWKRSPTNSLNSTPSSSPKEVIHGLQP